jgi:FecR protein
MLMDEDRYGRLAARVLAKRLTDNAAAHPGSARNGQAEASARISRDKLVPSVVLAIEARIRRRRIVQGGVVLAVAASALLTVRFALHTRSMAPAHSAAMAPMLQDLSGRGHLLFRAGAQQSISGPMVLAVGDRVHLGDDGGSRLEFADGTHVDMEAGTDIRIGELGTRRRILIDHGRLDVRVAKLGEGDRFMIATPDSEMEVHGTIFAVEAGLPSPACAATPVSTRVRVSEGVVSVRNHGEMVYLHAGDVWPCSENAATVPAATAPESPPANAGRAGVRPPRVAIRPSRLPLAQADNAGSSLAEQNDLFAQAIAAERKNQRELALRKLDELLRRFPGGPLDESARAERNKILPSRLR